MRKKHWFDSRLWQCLQTAREYSIYGEGSKSDPGSSGNLKNQKRASSQLTKLKCLTDVEKLLSDLTLLQILYKSFTSSKIKLLQDAINSICQNERTKVEIKAKILINKFNALYPEKEIKQFSKEYNAIEAIYKSLNQE